MLGEIDSMVQRYLIAASNRGSIISRAVATSTTKALMSKHPDLVGNIDLDSSSWAKSLFMCMGFVRRVCTTAKLEITVNSRKEIELVFLHQLVSKVEMYGIPPSLIINIDQTPSKYVSSSRTIMAKKNSKQVAITATFAVRLDGKFLPMQLIYGGKTKQSLPRFKFPDSFSLSVNPTHYSNEEESINFIKNIIVPYVEEQRSLLELPNQNALVLLDVFTGQTTPAVLKTCPRKHDTYLSTL